MKPRPLSRRFRVLLKLRLLETLQDRLLALEARRNPELVGWFMLRHKGRYATERQR